MSAHGPSSLLLRAADGREFTVTRHGLHFIGRDRACELAFPDDAIMSSRHAALFHDGTAFRVLDYKSRNATFVNDHETRLGTLRDGDALACGGQTLRAHLGTTASPSAPRLFQLEEPDPVVRGLVLLNRAASALLLQLDRARLRKRILGLSVELFQASRGFIVETGRTPPFVLRDHQGFAETPDPLEPCFLRILNHCATEGSPLLASRRAAAPDDPLVKPPRNQADDFDAYLAFPLKDGSRLHAVVYLNRKPGRTPFTRDETAILEPFARYATLALRASEKLAPRGAGAAPAGPQEGTP